MLPMDTDDLAPPPKKPRSYELGQDLSKLSVGELKALIDDLKVEIDARRGDACRQAVFEERSGGRVQALKQARSWFL